MAFLLVEDLEIGIRDDLVPAHIVTEDGIITEQMIYRVTAETKSGKRYAHEHTFKDVWNAEYLMGRIKMAKQINTDHFVEIDPVYGSDHYMYLESTGQLD